MTPLEAGAAILADTSTRKGFPEFWKTVSPDTQERVLEAWADIIGRVLPANENT